MAARNVYISWTMARRTCYAALFRRCVSWVIQIHLILISLGKKNITYRLCSCRVISRFTCDTWLWKRKEKIRIVNCVEEVLCVCSSLSHPARRNEMTVGSASFWIRVCQVFCVCRWWKRQSTPVLFSFPRLCRVKHGPSVIKFDAFSSQAKELASKRGSSSIPLNVIW